MTPQRKRKGKRERKEGRKEGGEPPHPAIKEARKRKERSNSDVSSM